MHHKGHLLVFRECSLSVNNLTLQDINVKGNSIELNNSKGILSGLTVERDTSQNNIINISNGSKIDFYNLKISQCKSNDGRWHIELEIIPLLQLILYYIEGFPLGLFRELLW